MKGGVSAQGCQRRLPRTSWRCPTLLRADYKARAGSGRPTRPIEALGDDGFGTAAEVFRLRWRAVALRSRRESTWCSCSARGAGDSLLCGWGKQPKERPLYAELEALVAVQATRIAELEALVAELRARLDRNSRNSSKPPSSDGGYDKPPAEKKKERSLRRRSGRKPGGQPGASRSSSAAPRRSRPDSSACGGGVRVLRARRVWEADRGVAVTAGVRPAGDAET